jgi:RNA polymerase sigma-70 factor (ECF subfamily)
MPKFGMGYAKCFLSQRRRQPHPSLIMKIMRGDVQPEANDTGDRVTHPSDEQLVERVKEGDLSAFELLVRRHNQRLYRAIRSVLRTGEEVEDAMQDAYFAALKHIGQFEGRAQFGTWLIKIGINEARARLRRRVRLVALDDLPADSEAAANMAEHEPVRTPEQQVGNHEIVAFVEAAIDRLPDDYRQVLVLRMVDSLDTAETAEVLGMGESAVRQRLHRAREMLEKDLERRVGSVMQSAFGFLGDRCDRIVAEVMRRCFAELGNRGA